MKRFVLPGLVAGLLAAACSGDAASGGQAADGGPQASPEASTDAAQGATDASNDAGAGEAGSDAAAAKCTVPLGPNEECHNGLPAPVFQGLPAGFYMDATEVTRSQYTAWLATKPSSGTLPAGCQGKTTFQPDATCMTSKLVCATSCDTHPQVCVDWCDAQTYCLALGKQLCGARPDAIAEGLTVGFTDYSNTELDQFEYACSADGKQQYVYADKYDPTACNTGCTGAGCRTIPVASNAKCQGAQNTAAFPGVFDLNGNVAEWDGTCASADPAAQCRVRGGDMQSTATTSTCDYGTGGALVARDTPQPTVGFRCCSAQ